VAKSWTDDAPKPVALQEHAHVKDPFSYKIKRFFLGSALNRHSLGHQRLSKRYALGILSSDCISSSAYGSEQILIALIPAFGLAAFSIIIPMTFVILGILVLLTLSYNNVIAKYTSSGGAYIVARENLGTFWSIVAAVALVVDYVVTIAVQSAAGVIAIISFFPSLSNLLVEMTVAVILLLTYGNLRGVKEAGKSFALPTYLFVISMFVVFGVGIYQTITGSIHKLPTHEAGMLTLGNSSGLMTIASIFILLRAFANGGSSLTGLEAISNGVSLFEAPEGRNARKTMFMMSGLLGTLVFGVSWFAHSMNVVPYESGTPSVISLISKTVMGEGTFGTFWFAFTQFSTMLILIAGANTVYNAFPILAANIANDGYFPRQLAKRGHKLVYSNGIILCAGLSIALVIAYGGSVNNLVALYAIGVFTAFTITGFGMFVNAKRERGNAWLLRAVISGVASFTSLLVVIIFAIVKFTEGAWLVLLVAPTLTFLMFRFNKQYKIEQIALSVNDDQERATSMARHDVTIFVDSVDIATVGAIRYARSLRAHKIKAVHFVIDDRRAQEILDAWATSDALQDIQLELIDCPDRRIVNSALDYAIRKTEKPDLELTILLPRRSYSRFLGRLLHDQTAEEIAAPISQLQRVVATIVPFDVNRITSGKPLLSNHKHSESPTLVIDQTSKPVQVSQEEFAPIEHYAEDVTPIGSVEWRKRSMVHGRVTSISTTPRGSAPLLQVEVWDQTGGITLNFLGRREIAGLSVGMEIRAEGMVGEEDGQLTILNPSYELLI